MPSTVFIFADVSVWYWTRSSSFVVGDGDGSVSGVYVMETLRLDFHMGRVECVTCQVPESHCGVGAVKEGCCWGKWVLVVGGRRVMGGWVDGIFFDPGCCVSLRLPYLRQVFCLSGR